MVDQSELPFRMLCRKYGADLCFTPMLHSRSFAMSASYRARYFTTTSNDRPLVVQFCGHDPNTVLAAAKLVESQCDAVDLNLGCPQGIARRGFYGSYLMEHWDVVHTILHTLSVELRVPVTAKIRLFDDMDTTLRYAKMIHDAGVSMLTVHGRTRVMKGQYSGNADLHAIARIRDAFRDIPIIANGKHPRGLGCGRHHETDRMRRGDVRRRALVGSSFVFFPRASDTAGPLIRRRQVDAARSCLDRKRIPEAE